MGDNALLGLSILFQLATVFLAWRLIPVTGKRRAWLLISAALCLMVLGRFIVLYACLTSPAVCPYASSQMEKWMNLLISALLLAGVAWISPLFLSVKTAEENLRKSEEKYRTLFEDSRDAIFQSTRKGEFAEMNPFGLELFGCSHREILEKNAASIYVNPDDRLNFQEEIEKTGSVKDYEVRLRKSDGSEMDCLITATVLRDRSGAILGYRGIIRNVTEIKEVLRSLDAERERFYILLNELPAFVDLRGRDHAIKFANRRFREDFGCPSNQACYELLEGRSSPCEDCPNERVLAGTSPLEFEWNRPDGRTYQVYKYPFVDVDGAPVVLELGIDATDRKRAEEALRESEAKYRELVQNANSIILRMDTRGSITFFNEFAQSFFGYAEREIVGLNIVGTIVPDTGSARTDLTATILGILHNPGGFHGTETENVRRNGEKVWIAWTNKIILDKNGEPEGILCIGNDVSQQKRLEEQYRQSQKMEAIGRLAGGIAHDFNNLLTIILGYSEVLQYQLRHQTPAIFEAIAEIKDAAERSSALVRQLLTFSRQQMLMPKVLNINTIVIETEKMLRRLIGEDIYLTTTLRNDLWRVKADPGQIEQVILNLAINARDAMPEGGAFSIETANVLLERESSIRHINLRPGRYVKIDFTDTGIGIDEETLSRVFDPFFTTKEQGKGTGLGLATVYGIVKQSEGDIAVFSARGKGTTFTIYLPGVEEEDEAAAKPLAPVRAGRGAETVLLVEDDDSLRKIISKILSDNGYRAIEASRAEEALSIVERNQEVIHLMVVDLVLPGMSGRKLATRMAVRCPDVKILFISGYMEDSADSIDNLEPATDFLQKPFSPPVFLQRVQNLLNLPHTERKHSMGVPSASA